MNKVGHWKLDFDFEGYTSLALSLSQLPGYHEISSFLYGALPTLEVNHELKPLKSRAKISISSFNLFLQAFGHSDKELTHQISQQVSKAMNLKRRVVLSIIFPPGNVPVQEVQREVRSLHLPEETHGPADSYNPSEQELRVKN